MNKLPQKIIDRLYAQGRGSVFTPRDFIDLGSRAAIDQALSRLAKQGTIKRISRGIYHYPKLHKIMGPLWPSTLAIAQAVAKNNHSRIQPTGAQAMYALGLTQQLPIRAVFLTDGPDKNLTIGNTKVKFKHVSPSTIAGAGLKAGLVIQAMLYMGKDGLDKDMLIKIQKLLDNKDKKDLLSLLRFTPPWARPLLMEIAQT